MKDHELLRRLYITEQHLNLALSTLKMEDYADTRNLLLNALSTIGQIQEILEKRSIEEFEYRRAERDT